MPKKLINSELNARPVRKKLTKDQEKNVLVRSRRRCCICFGLNKDTSQKNGQIAHLDRRPNNNDEANLAFLCFDHHDEYDSKTRQKKGFSIEEVKHYRKELFQSLVTAFASQVSIGMVQAVRTEKFIGYYVRTPGGSPASIEITKLPPSIEMNPRYHIDGFALWGVDRKYGPNMGSLDFFVTLEEDEMIYTEKLPWKENDCEKDYKITLNFLGERLIVTEENIAGVHGMNVTFEGEYVRKTDKTS